MFTTITMKASIFVRLPNLKKHTFYSCLYRDLNSGPRSQSKTDDLDCSSMAELIVLVWKQLQADTASMKCPSLIFIKYSVFLDMRINSFKI